jgi:hypothetical protein
MGDILISRRSLIAAGASVSAALGAPAALLRAAAVGGPAETLNMRNDGSYATVPLGRNDWTLGVVQSRVLAVDPSNARTKRRENVQHMFNLIDYANGFSGKKDLRARAESG